MKEAVAAAVAAVAAAVVVVMVVVMTVVERRTRLASRFESVYYPCALAYTALDGSATVFTPISKQDVSYQCPSPYRRDRYGRRRRCSR